jgi:hypothetical protein
MGERERLLAILGPEVVQKDTVAQVVVGLANRPRRIVQVEDQHRRRVPKKALRDVLAGASRRFHELTPEPLIAPCGRRRLQQPKDFPPQRVAKLPGIEFPVASDRHARGPMRLPCQPGCRGNSRDIPQAWQFLRTPASRGWQEMQVSA